MSIESSTLQEGRKRTNVFARHWRGELPLWVSYWLFGALLSVALLFAMNATAAIPELIAMEPRATSALVLFVTLSVVVVVVWQLVGIWRSAEKHQQRGGRALWANLAKVAVVLGCLRFLADATTQTIPVVYESAKLLVAGDATPAHQIRLLRDGTELELAGGMPFGTTDAVKKFLDAAPTVKVIHLNNSGGRIAESVSLSRLIRERQLTTYTATDCLSACAFAFVAGNERFVGEKGRLGFHSASIGDLSGHAAIELNKDVEKLLRSANVSDDFVRRALSTPANDMWYPSSKELLQAKVIDAVVDSKAYGVSGVSQWRDAYRLEQTLLSMQPYLAIQKFDKPNYDRLRTAFVDGVQRGRTTTEIRSSLRAILTGEMIPAYLKKAPDDALFQYWKVQIAEIGYLAKHDPQLCADFVFPQFAKTPIDLSAVFPQELMTQDVDALAVVVEGAAKSPVSFVAGPTIASDLDSVAQRISRSSPWAIGVLQRADDFKKEPELLCGATLTFLSEITAMPNRARAVALLRHVGLQ